MAQPNTVSFVDRTGKRSEVDLAVEDYMEAAHNKVSLSQHYAMKYPTDMDKDGSPLEQFAMSAGIRLRPDPARGIGASTMQEIMHGYGNMSAGTLLNPQRPSNTATLASRILFPEVLMQMVNDILVSSKEDYLVPWENAIAMKSSVVGPRVDQPRIDVTAPEQSRAQPIGQLAEPAVMISITMNAKSYTIPTKSIGLQISDEAQAGTTIDLVSLSVAGQARGERIARLEQDMANIINGDVDSGVLAVPFANASTFDPAATINAGNPITHTAWLTWLHQDYQRLNKTHILTSLSTMIAVANRSGRPLKTEDLSTEGNRVPADFSIMNLNIQPPGMLILPDSIIGPDRMVGFDRQYALHQITNSSASYSAVENWVLRRGSGFRFDYGTALFKLREEAFSGIVLKA